MSYQPAPLDTTAVTLPPEVVALTGLLARNAHDVGARQRLRDGWTWGPQRDDARKQHPALVPYEELSESEREYDRQVAMETVKTIVVLGYRIAAG